MKTIQCDICKSILGREVNAGGLYAIATSEYSPADFQDNGFFIDPHSKTKADICRECANKITDAQNEAIKKIRKLTE